MAVGAALGDTDHLELALVQAQREGVAHGDPVVGQLARDHHAVLAVLSQRVSRGDLRGQEPSGIHAEQRHVHHVVSRAGSTTDRRGVAGVEQRDTQRRGRGTGHPGQVLDRGRFEVAAGEGGLRPGLEGEVREVERLQPGGARGHQAGGQAGQQHTEHGDQGHHGPHQQEPALRCDQVAAGEKHGRNSSLSTLCRQHRTTLSTSCRHDGDVMSITRGRPGAGSRGGVPPAAAHSGRARTARGGDDPTPARAGVAGSPGRRCMGLPVGQVRRGPAGGRGQVRRARPTGASTCWPRWSAPTVAARTNWWCTWA